LRHSPEGSDEQKDAKKKAQFAKMIPAIVAMIQDKGRKYHVEATIGVHGGKSKRTDIDSDALMQMHWLAMDNAMTFPNTPILSTLKSDPNVLEGSRARSLPYTGPGEMFATTGVLRCVRSKGVEPCEMAVGIPWIDFSKLEVIDLTEEPTEEDRWIAENREPLWQAYQDGATSLRALIKVTDITHRYGWKYEALKRLRDEFEERSEPDDHTGPPRGKGSTKLIAQFWFKKRTVLAIGHCLSCRFIARNPQPRWVKKLDAVQLLLPLR
jgi:hypothetical protein